MGTAVTALSRPTRSAASVGEIRPPMSLMHSESAPYWRSSVKVFTKPSLLWTGLRV